MRNLKVYSLVLILSASTLAGAATAEAAVCTETDNLDAVPVFTVLKKSKENYVSPLWDKVGLIENCMQREFFLMLYRKKEEATSPLYDLATQITNPFQEDALITLLKRKENRDSTLWGKALEITNEDQEKAFVELPSDVFVGSVD